MKYSGDNKEILIYYTLAKEYTLALKLCHKAQTKITFPISYTVATDGVSKD